MRYRIRVMFILLSGLLAVSAVGQADAVDEWTRTYGELDPANFSTANGLTIAPDGSMYVVGAFFGEFEGLVAEDGFDGFVMKLSPSGAVEWKVRWDPDSMDSIDFSNLDFYGGEAAWLHSPRLGRIVIDGAGNLIVTLSDGVGVFDDAGNLLSEVDNPNWSMSGPPRQLLGQRDGDGGALVILGQGSDDAIVAVDTSLNVEWGPIEKLGGQAGAIAMPDGGAVVVADVAAEAAFQSVRQVVRRFDSDGDQAWSTAHIGRCSGYGGNGGVPMFERNDDMVVLSRFAEGPDCNSAAGNWFMSRYSLATGEWIDDVALPYLNTGNQSYSCQTDADIVVVENWNDDGCGGSSPYSMIVGQAFPWVATNTVGVYSLLQMTVDPPLDPVEPVIAYFHESTSAFTLTRARRLTSGPGTVFMDSATTPDGLVVAIGNTDGTAAPPSVNSVTPSAASNPQALVLFNPVQPSGAFLDDDGSVFETDIEWLAGENITKGCNPPTNDRFCPDDHVTRGQMAAFLVRALGLTDRLDDPFIDDDDSIFEADIERLAAAGITKGCNPSEGNTKFCPDARVTREQMAAFLVRALGYTDDGGGNLFTDDDESIFEADIDRMATAGVTKGCNPPTNTMFCPTSNVTRGQMAAFLHRALG